MQYWEDVQLYHMSEESDNESGNPEVIIIHKPQWRSERTYMYALITVILCTVCLLITALNRFLDILDERYAKSSRSKADVFVRKTRKIGEPSSLLPPPDAPKLTVSEAS